MIYSQHKYIGSRVLYRGMISGYGTRLWSDYYILRVGRETIDVCKYRNGDSPGAPSVPYDIHKRVRATDLYPFDDGLFASVKAMNASILDLYAQIRRIENDITDMVLKGGEPAQAVVV